MNSGPKRKRRLLDNHEISLYYTRLEIVLPAENYEGDTENYLINSMEVLQQVGVWYQV